MRPFLITATLVAATATGAFAHDTWMLAAPPAADGTVMLAITSGMDFPRNESGPKANRVARGGWRLGGNEGTLPSGTEGDSVLTLRVAAKGEGTGVAYASFLPRDIDLEEDEVTHYMEEIGASDELRRAWESAGPGRTFHEVYTKHVKAFARVGGTAADPSCLAPVGLAIEFVPAVDPTALRAGDTLEVKVLKNGKPFPGFAVGAVCGADGAATMQHADANGVVTFPIHRAGPWLVRGTELRRNDDGTWASDFTTMTFTAGGQ